MIAKTHPHVEHPALGTIIGVDVAPSVEAFLGVPYGSISERWTYARPRDHLDRYEATTYGPRCPQPPGNPVSSYGPMIYCGSTEQDEDEFRCLNLNIHRPKDVSGPVPVLVWIHGGAFLSCSASDPLWDPTNLVRWSAEQGSPIIVVGINYRLGPFGFLYSSALDQEERPDGWRGNFGLHDQRVALEWIQRHIRGFGGDPDKITIVGESSGAYAIHAQISCTTHLDQRPPPFSRAIIQSGPLAPRHIWSLRRLDRIWRSIADADSRGDSTRNEVERMRRLSPEDLTHRALQAKVGTWGVFDDGVFVSRKLYNEHWDFRAGAEPRVVAVMIGDNADERSVFLKRVGERGLNVLRPILEAEIGHQSCDAVLHAYTSVYNDPATSSSACQDTDGDITFLSHIAQDLRYLYPTDALTSAWPSAWRYHVGLPNPFEEANDSHRDMAHHGVDVMYLFRNYEEHFSSMGMEMPLRVADEMGRAWLRLINGKAPWASGRVDGDRGAYFGKKGMMLVPRGQVRQDEQKDKLLAMWREVGLVKVGRIANLWISEQNGRQSDEDFVY